MRTEPIDRSFRSLGQPMWRSIWLNEGGEAMVKFLLFCILLVLCWPLALMALVLYPLIWIVLLPFRIVGIAVEGVLDLIRAIFLFPVRVLR